MYTYPKIETLFKRDVEGSKKLIEGLFRNSTIEMLADYPIWVATEKLDGTNVQIYWDGHCLNFGGRTEKTNMPSHVQFYYDTKFANNETEELFEQLFADKKFVLYFEAIGNKIQTFGRHYGNVRFVLLDVYSVDSDCWLQFDSIQNIAKALNIECKRALMRDTLSNIIEYVKSKPMSLFCQDSDSLPMEGVVCTPYKELKDSNGERIIVKIKGCDHVADFSQFIKSYK